MERTTSRRQQGGHWRKSALLTRVRRGGGYIGGVGGLSEQQSMAPFLFVSFFFYNVPTVRTTEKAGRQEKRERPPQSKRGTAGVAVVAMAGKIFRVVLRCPRAASLHSTSHTHM